GRACRESELHGRDADTASGGGHEHGVTGTKVEGVDGAFRGIAHETDGCRGGPIDFGRFEGDVLRGNDDVRGLRSRAGPAEHLVADGEARHTFADFVDYARELGALSGGKRVVGEV